MGRDVLDGGLEPEDAGRSEAGTDPPGREDDPPPERDGGRELPDDELDLEPPWEDAEPEERDDADADLPPEGGFPPDGGLTARTAASRWTAGSHRPDDDPPLERGLPVPDEGGRDPLLRPLPPWEPPLPPEWLEPPEEPRDPPDHWMSCEGIPHRTACRSLTIPLDRVSLPRSAPLPPHFAGAPSAPNRSPSIRPNVQPHHALSQRDPGHDRTQAHPRKRKGPPQWGDPFRKNVRQRPTLPQGPPCSTIGAERLSFRVRNGTGRFPLAMTAETLLRYDPRPYLGNRTVDANIRNDCEWTSPRPISTGQLHTLPCFHFRPINPVVYWGPYQVNPVGVLILERASRLDAFSGYHFRT